MKKFSPLLLALCLLATTALAAETPSVTAGEAAVKQIIDRANPSLDNMGLLSALTGNWSYTAQVWAKPGAEPQTANGSVANEIVLDNRFLSSSFTGYLNIDGLQTPYRGQALIGYDTEKKSFISNWVDTLGTGMTAGSGTYNEKEKAITETGRFTNPVTGAEETFRAETKLTSSDSYERTIFSTGKSGKESKLMEFKYFKPGYMKAE
jgi:hypothetical protein